MAVETEPVTAVNLRRIMVKLNMGVADVVNVTKLDRRTVQGILDGDNKQHTKTLRKLTDGLGIDSDELFVPIGATPDARFDFETNPVVAEVQEEQPTLFAGWTAHDFADLCSHRGHGGALTREGVIDTAKRMNTNRRTLDRAATILETDQGEMLTAVVNAIYRKIEKKA